TLFRSNDVFTEGISVATVDNLLVELGILKKNVLKHFDIKQEVLFADFNWTIVSEAAARHRTRFSDIPKYPEVRRDLALLLDKNVSFEEVFNIAVQSENKLLKDVNLFDVYEGDKLPSGKKSYAVSFTLQDNEKTLTDKQIDQIMNKLQQNFEKQLNAELR